VVLAEADPSTTWDVEAVADPVEYHQRLLAAGAVLMAQLPGTPLQTCWLYDMTEQVKSPPPIQSLADVVDDLSLWRNDEDVLDVTTGYVDLPAGRAVVGDIRFKDGYDERDYVFTDGRMWFELDCGTDGTAPDDRWLFIAESFEYLPVEA
jgi:hypothetical protein